MKLDFSDKFWDGDSEETDKVSKEILEYYRNYVEEKEKGIETEEIFVFNHYRITGVFVKQTKSLYSAVFDLVCFIYKNNPDFFQIFISTLRDEPYCHWYRPNGEIKMEETDQEYEPESLSELIEMATFVMKDTLDSQDCYLFDYQLSKTNLNDTYVN